ncbi:hypothetical protein AMJ80_07900 [bacterium SM23_31]|nr:MAG: hypothetical protein AMJ80_07900 [bacterium SM23_31]
MKELWTRNKEIEFFQYSRKFATPEQLFYLGDDRRYYAYWPKSYKGKTETLQSRNSLIGNFTEKYSVDLLQDYANLQGWYAVQGVICKEIGLTAQSPADVVFCQSRNRIQKASDIFAIFEVKMSTVWNWELLKQNEKEELVCLGDFKTHKGNPGLLRSDSMLKAIGKSINIRVSGYYGSRIPIIILGNTPITESYIPKVEHLKNAGISQGFWSVNPIPLDDNGNNIKSTKDLGFYRFDTYEELITKLDELMLEDREYFSSMRTKKDLGRIIEIANQEDTYEKKAEKFLNLIRE